MDNAITFAIWINENCSKLKGFWYEYNNIFYYIDSDVDMTNLYKIYEQNTSN